VGGFFGRAEPKFGRRMMENALPGKGRFVRADPGKFNKKRLLLNLGEGLDLEVLRKRIEHHPNGAVAWVGRVKGDPTSEVILTRKGKAMAGVIRFQERLFKLSPVGDDTQMLSEVSPDDPRPEMEPLLPPVQPDATGGDATATSVGDGTPTAQADAGTMVDVMVVYTPAAKAQYGGTDGIEALITLAISETNQAYINSQVDAQLRLVHTHEVDYVESGAMNTDLERLTFAGDGFMDEVQGLRDDYDADLVSLFIESTDFCGLAWQMTSISTSFAPFGYSVIWTQCATGFYTFAHELAHNAGAQHERANAGPALFPYSFGFQFIDPDPLLSFRTIMAFNCPDGCVRIQHFSNPLVDYDGVPTGFEDSEDNARTLNQSLPTVAQFRQTLLELPPLEPTDLAATSVTFDEVALTWTDNADDEGGYRVERSENGVDFTRIATLAANTTAFTDVDVAEQTTYYYRVSAFNAAGRSGFSNTLEVLIPAAPPPPPGTPIGVTATAINATTVVVRWTDNATGEEGYRVERSADNGATWALAALLGPDASGYLNLGLTAATTYLYRVAAYAGELIYPYSPSVAVTTDQLPDYVPPAPTDLTASLVDSKDVALSWTDNSDDELRFDVERSRDGGLTWTLLSILAPNTTGYIDASTGGRTDYLYRTRAVAEFNASPYSNVAAITTPAPPPDDIPEAPSSLTATALSDSEVQLTWQDNADNELGVEVERSADAGNTWTLVATLGIDATSYVDSGLAPITTYLHRVRATGLSGDSAYSNPTRVTTEPTPVNCSVIGASSLRLGIRTTDWTLTNTGDTTVTIARVDVTWPAGQGNLQSINEETWTELWSGDRAPTQTVVDDGWNADISRRQLRPGQQFDLTLWFSRFEWRDAQSDYAIRVDFAEGCSVEL
jgi:fibronectin type 3 domain-containing protein